MPPRTGDYLFSLANVRGKATLNINGQEPHGKALALTANAPVPIVLNYIPGAGKSSVTLNWIVPAERKQDPAGLITRAGRDGTTIIIADHADTWMDLVKAAAPVTYAGTFKLGGDWIGGQYFAVEHPLFKDLPVNVALSWLYQSVVSMGISRYGLRLEGEQLAAGCWQSVPMSLGTAVGVIPSGEGKIVVSTLDICSHLNDPDRQADVARKLLCNYIEFAGKKGK